MADQRPGGDDPTRVIRSSPGTSAGRSAATPQSGRAPDAPPGYGVHAPGERPPGQAGFTTPVTPRGPRRPNGPVAPQFTGAPSDPTPRRRRRIGWKPVVAIVVLALVVYPVALFLVAWTHLGRVDALPANTAATPGRTYLV